TPTRRGGEARRLREPAHPRGAGLRRGAQPVVRGAPEAQGSASRDHRTGVADLGCDARGRLAVAGPHETHALRQAHAGSASLVSSLPDRGGLAGRLRGDAQRLGVSLDEAQTDALVEYLAQLARWNRTYNLTAIRDVEAMRVQHVMDCLAIVPVLREQLADSASILDVGSGGGLPGV